MVPQNPVKKLVIPLAGFGTRFLPTSKNYPKEMVNLVDKPVIQYLVEEAYNSGIREIIFVLNGTKQIIADYFSPRQHPAQKKALKDSATAQENLKELHHLLDSMKFRTVKKTVTLGDGHSVLSAKSAVGNEPFALTMGDLLGRGEKPFLAQLIGVYNEVKAPVVSVQNAPREEVSKFGVIAVTESKGRLHKVGDVVEKPKPEEAPSTYILTGKYILTPAIFKYLNTLVRNHRGGEVRTADGLKAYAPNHDLYAYECEGVIEDTGSKLDFLKATVRFALAHKTFGGPFKKFLKSLEL